MSKYLELKNCIIEYRTCKNEKRKKYLENAIFNISSKFLNAYFQKKIFESSNISKATEANDMTYSVMTKVFNNIDEYDENFSPTTWLSNIAQNYFIDETRKKSNKKSSITSHFSAMGSVFNENDKHDNSIENGKRRENLRQFHDSAELNSSIEFVNSLIDRLDSEKQRVALRLVSSGYKYEEISKKMDANINTTKQYVRNARININKLFNQSREKR